MLNNLFKKGFIIGIILLFISAGVLPSLGGKDIDKYSKIKYEIESNSDWYYLKSYPNYAPHGLPDFNQTQQYDWKNIDNHNDCCGATCLANIFWWFDSKNEDSNGYPGDGFDNYSLVQIYHSEDNCTPGPLPDDHNYNNVNDLDTPYYQWRNTGELIEKIAWYTNRQKDSIIIQSLPNFFITIFNAFKLCYGAKKWICKNNLCDDFSVITVIKPDFNCIDKCVRQNKGVIVGFAVLDESEDVDWGHFVSVAGINSNGFIALSDPVWDKENYSESSIEHNNPYYVSHDIYEINFTTPLPFLSSWCIPDYAGKHLGVVEFALIISQKENQ